MKSALISVVVAAIVSIVVLSFDDVFERDDDDRASDSASATSAAAAADRAGMSLSYTDELPEDVWVNGRTPGSDRRSLADATHSVCYLTKLEIKGVQSAQDSNSCVIVVDDFTGFWELVVTVAEEGQSEVRCNARCLVWE
jgi:hypothetical protein